MQRQSNIVFGNAISKTQRATENKPFNPVLPLRLDLLPSHPLRPPSASEEGPLLHSAADDPADHPVCVRDVSSALHEDGLPPADDPAGPRQVRRPSQHGNKHGATMSA